MKRIDQKVPGFDEIIFENRNKSYGAYDLRKKYKSAISFSLLGGITIASVPVILFFILSPEPAKAKSDNGLFVVIQTDNLTEPAKIIPPEPPKPVSFHPQYRYVEPKVVDDTVNLTNLMITDIAKELVTDNIAADNTDTITYSPPVTDNPEEPEPYTFVQEQPIFPGGHKALLKYIAENTVYPPVALEINIQGKVYVKFAVASDGTVKKLEIIRGVHPLLDEEAIRVISTLPRWQPGKQNGKPVPVWFNVPVTFEIRNY